MKSTKQRVTISVLAAGFSAAFLTMQLKAIKDALDIVYYEIHFDLYTPIRLLICIGMLSFNILVSGRFLVGKFSKGGSDE